jgi:NAD-dependent deacetylase sirtuin 4
LYNRKRYWLRSFFGYERVAKSKPNSIHFNLTELQKQGLISSIITQNVDGLHQKSGSKDVVEMHGSLDNVGCTSCGYQISRDDFQFQLKHLNPNWERFFKPEDPSDIKTTPDGDVQLSDSTNYDQFNLPDCPKCDTPTFKPKVVFFGENMTPKTRDQIYGIIKENQMLLVLGSSLTVPSAYRLVLASREFSIVNLSPTKYDDQAKLAYYSKIDEFLDQVVKLKN